MSRTLTSNAATSAVTKAGTEPLIVVKVTWPTSGAIYYSDRLITSAAGRIKEISSIESKVINRRSANAGTVTVTLIDTDQDIFTKLQSQVLTNSVVSVYQHWIGNTWITDFVLLYSGVVASPFTYDELNRTLTFTIIPPVKSFQLPFTPTEDQVTSANDAHSFTEKRFRGKPWPMAFGNVIDLPAQQVVEGPRAVTIGTIQVNITSFVIETSPIGDPNPFPISTAMSIYVNDELMTGSFNSSKTFTITARNAVISTPSTPSTRPAAGTDPDTARADVLYVAGSANANGVTKYPKLSGLWVTPTGPAGKIAGSTENYCIKQIGNKCFFQSAWGRTGTAAWLVGGTNSGVADGAIALSCRRFSQATGTIYQHSANSPVSKASQRAKYYVVSDNLHISSDLKRVRAYRQVPIGGVNSNETVRQLVSVPNAYWEFNPTYTNAVHVLLDGTNRSPAMLKFDPPLSERDEGWEDDVIYCSISSSFTSGNDRLTSQQIKYILDKYTLLTPDSSSFTAVDSLLANFPSDWGLSSPRDALDLVTDMAWQARCALIINGSTVKIKYLSIAEPSSGDGNITISDAYVCNDQDTSIEETAFEDKITVFVANYQLSYAFPQLQKIIKRINTTTLNEKIEEQNFFIYQNQDLVDASAEWWAQHWGRIWKLLNIHGPLPLITFDAFDFCTVNLPNIIYTGSFKATVLGLKHDTLSNVISLQIQTPIAAGTNSKSSFGWLSVPSPSPSIGNPLSGLGTTADDLVSIASSQDGS